ncbi:patatin-like phospholipase family protein [Shewanella maritima]|uniref:patatin-like phospholipase family protein n=1 Tax=Shewanella maritima TaxID=2520507 RepID=UPI003734DA1F
MLSVLRDNYSSRLLFLLFLVFSPFLAFAEQEQPVTRPTVGLVLSGGGAKGAAHIGVLKVLEANRIPVDYIAGTSIGAYVGGMYALGYSAEEIETIMMASQWSEGYSDFIPREALSYRDKQFRDRYNIPLNLGFNRGEITAPTGLLVGQTMSLLLRQSTDLVQQYGDFDELSIPYRAVSTDLETSQAVVLDGGSIVQAMQASATVPGALQPAELDGKLLVDGGIANNMPVDVVKALGADIVIAVDIGSTLSDKSKLTSTISVLEQLSTMLTRANAIKQKKLLTEQDILIRPAVDNLSTTDFSVMPQALILGISAANEHLAKLQDLGVAQSEFDAYVAQKLERRKAWSDPLERPIVEVRFANDSKVSEKVLREKLDIQVGDVVTKESLNDALKRVYSLNKFERVDAEFQDTEDGRVLTVTAQQKSWGPNYFQAGFNWEDDFTLESAMSVNLAYIMADLTEYGGEWRNELQLGYRTMIATEFYLPIDKDQRFYGISRFQFDIKKWTIYSENQLVHNLSNNVGQIKVGVGSNYSHAGAIELGLSAEKGRIEQDFYLENDLDYRSVGSYFSIGYDTLDSISFPTQGNRFRVLVHVRDERFKSDLLEAQDGVTWELQADWKGAVHIGNHAFVGKAELSTIEADNNFTVHPAELGGFLNLSGYHRNALAGAHKVFGAAIYQYDLARSVLSTDKPWYLGFSIEGGNVWDERDDINIDELIFAGSLFLGTDTEWGPAAVGLGASDTGEKAFYLFLGKNF